MNWSTVEDLQKIMLIDPREFGYKDPWFLREFLGLINIFNPTSLIETGTWQGGMIQFITTLYDSLPIFSCDVLPLDDIITKFAHNENIQLHQMDSQSFLKTMVDYRVGGELPFFFLDAHAAMDPNMETNGINFNPLANEMEEVIKYGKAVICIHDFEVPGLPIFGHGSKFTIKDKKHHVLINLESIQEELTKVKCGIWFPYFPARLLHTDKVNWRSLFDLRGRVYIILNPNEMDLTKMKVLEDFGVLWKYHA
jgi:hypothetical protein